MNNNRQYQEFDGCAITIRIGVILIAISLTVGGVLLVMKGNQRPEWDNLNSDNCLVNDTDIISLGYKQDNMFQLKVTYMSYIDEITYLCSHMNKQSNDYTNLKTYSELEYPLYAESNKCYFNKKNNKTEYTEDYQNTLNAFDGYYLGGVVMLIFAAFIWLHQIMVWVWVLVDYCRTGRIIL